MTGVIVSPECVQRCGILSDRVLHIQLGKMKTADEYIGAKKLGNLEDSAMGATTDKDAFAVFLDEQILLVTVILIVADAVDLRT